MTYKEIRKNKEIKAFIKRARINLTSLGFTDHSEVHTTLVADRAAAILKDGNIIWFKNEDRIDGEFFYHSFNGSFIQNFIKESAGIGTVGTYTIESGKKTPILLPTQKDEQQKIGTFFSQLDTLITLHQRKCDKYKSIKAGLIRKFFP